MKPIETLALASLAFGVMNFAGIRSAVAQDSIWTTKEPMPFVSADPWGAVIGEVFYSICPNVPHLGEPSRLLAYDPATDSWESKSPMLIQRHGVAVGVGDNEIYIAGGWDGGGDHGELEVYDPMTDGWTLKNPMPMPVRSPAGAVLDGIFYVTGGAITYPQPATPLQTVFAYNPVTDSWSTRAPMPTARGSHGVAAINGILYAVGGNSPAGVFSTLEAYDPITDTWSTKTPMPTARYLISVTVLNGLLYAAGGVDVIGNYLDTVEAYNPVTDSWATLSSMPTARQQPALGALDGKIYAAGGYTPTSGSLSVLEVFTPNDAPISDAGPDQSVNEGEAVQLDGSASSDPTPTGTLTFHWTQLAGTLVTLSNAHIYNPNFTAPFVQIGGETLTFQLKVSDGEFTANDVVNITVVNVNHTPVADAGADQNVQETSTVTLHGENSFDADGDLIDFSWVQIAGPSVTLTAAESANPTFTAPVIPGGDPNATVMLTFQLTVDDRLPKDRPADGFTFANATDTINVRVSNVDQPPIANAGPDQTVVEGSTVTLHGENSADPDGDSLSFDWVQTSGMQVTLVGAHSANPTFTAPVHQSGGTPQTFALTVNDGFGKSAIDDVTISLQSINAPPDCTNARPTVPVLWPPNHKLVSVEIAGVRDDQAGVTIVITGVTQDEPTTSQGDGDIGPDAVIQGNKVLLRAERDGAGNGRVYRVSFTATDDHGETCAGAVKVCVPHDMKSTCVDGGQQYDSTAAR
jgi:N-acetylneuraminic acid mutarotase